MYPPFYGHNVPIVSFGSDPGAAMNGKILQFDKFMISGVDANNKNQ